MTTPHDHKGSVHTGLLQVEGAQAKLFLQGQLTADLNTVTQGTSHLAAHCNPQGRVISLFRLFLQDEKYVLHMPRSLVPIAMQALKKYAVFFKVSLTDRSAELSQFHLPLGSKKMDIANGIPAIYPETSEKFLPHDLNLPMLGAVSFDKGCYTGQEIIARMQYRGKLKKHLYRAILETPCSLTPGADIYLDGNSVGSLVDFYENELLVIADEKDAAKQKLTIDPEQKNILTLQV